MKRLIWGILLSTSLWAQTPNRAEVQLQTAVNRETVDGDLKGAIELYRKVAADHRGNRLIASRALLRMAEAQEKLGEVEARKAYEQIVREYADQQPAKVAQARLATLGKPSGVVARRLVAPAPEWWTGTPNPASPDGRYLFVALNESGKWSPAVLDLNSGRHRKLTKPVGSGFIDTGVISSDNRWVAYTAQPMSSKLELFVANFDGSNIRKVLDSSAGIGWLYPVGFTSDNREIVIRFNRAGSRGYHLGRVSVADGALNVIKEFSGEQLIEARLSPDGRWIAFSYRKRAEAPNADISVMSTQGDSESVIVDHAADDRWPLWTADGKGLFFVSNRRGSNDLMLAPISGGKPAGAQIVRKQDIGNAELFGATASGSVVYRVATGSQKFLYAAWNESTEKYGPFQPLEESFTGQKYRPQLSPDGKQLAYVRRPDYAKDRAIIGVRDLTTGKEREVLPILRNIQYVHWMPDMRQFLVVGRNHGDQLGDYLVDTQTGETKPLPPDGDTMGYVRGQNAVVVSPDGKSLYCTTGRRGKGAVFAKDLSSGAMRLLVEAQGLANAPYVSPDGRWLAYYDNGEKRVGRIVSIADGTVRDLPDGISVQGWERDSKSIFVFSEKESRQTLSNGQTTFVLYRMPLEGGALTPINEPVDTNLTDSLQIVGKSAVYRDNKQHRELWSLDNVLPGASR